MEIEKSPPEIAKKLWNIVRVVFYMMRKNISKSKIMLDLHMLLKRGKIASKALGSLMLHHRHNYYSALTCRSNDNNMSFVSPREYEFSCSNTPNYHKRKNHHHQQHAEELKIMHKVFDILNRYDAVAEASPLAALPGYGTEEMNMKHQVDKDAEEFIKKFYRDLKNQKRIAALESPSPYHLWAN